MVCCKGHRWPTASDHERYLKDIKRGVIDPELVGIWIHVPKPGNELDTIDLKIFKKNKILNEKVSYYKKLKEFGCRDGYKGNQLWVLEKKGIKGVYISIYDYYPPDNKPYTFMMSVINYTIKGDSFFEPFGTEFTKLEKYDKEMYDKLLKTDLPCMDLSTINND
ncbi:hypothetical protein [Ichthyobacterium seriolicida]|uniref:hypothetical protein n=1 Tax=Ichthyobacterium seriolicida TaxID=242600 RepID=UPI000BBBE210|nr:hypothetical protein [Ichthyobacterium seriolicida]